jgi:hypothetical protein
MRAVALRAELALGRTDEVRRRFEAVVAAGLEQLPRNIRYVSTLLELGHLCADLRDRERAAEFEAMLAPFSSLHGVLPVPICYGGPVAAALARLAALQGRTADARELHAEAVAAAESLGAHPTANRLRSVEAGALS